MKVIDYRYGLDLPALLHRHTRTALRGITFRKLANLGIFAAEMVCRPAHSRCRPFYLKIEPTNVCDLHCSLCGTLSPRPKGFMNMATYRDVIDYFSAYCMVNGLYGQGESFLHPAIFDMIAYSESCKCPVSISTNFNSFNSEKCERVLDSGLSYIIVCIDGATQEMHASYRKGGSLDNVLRNMRTLAELKSCRNSRTPIIEVQTADPGYSIANLNAISKMASENGADVHRIRGNMLTSNTPIRPRGVCPYLYGSLFIAWDGRVAPCEGSYMEPQHFICTFDEVKNGMDCSNNERLMRARLIQKNTLAACGTTGLRCDACQ